MNKSSLDSLFWLLNCLAQFWFHTLRLNVMQKGMTAVLTADFSRNMPFLSILIIRMIFKNAMT